MPDEKFTLEVDMKDLQVLREALGGFAWDGSHRLYDLFDQVCRTMEAEGWTQGEDSHLPPDISWRPVYD